MIVDDFRGELALHRLKLGENNPEDILKLYQSNVYFSKISSQYPPKIENVTADMETVPEVTDADHKFFVSIYNSRQLLAVLDFIDGYRYQENNKQDTVWLGLFSLDQSFHGKGNGGLIMDAFSQACRKNGKKALQLGVIRENKPAMSFWNKQGFRIIAEDDNGKYDLCIMEKML